MLPTTFSVVIAHFIPIRLQKWPPQAILVSEWPIFENLGQMYRNGAIFLEDLL
jgi:hypothetical protein